MRIFMSHLKKSILTYLLPIFAVSIVSFTYKDSPSSDMYLCKQTYALCTSAQCVPLPGNPSQAICFCDVEEGSSMSTIPCDQLTPSTDVQGIHTVYSTFSLKQYFRGKKGMKCPAGSPWTWCLNKKCTVDPMNPHFAICTCDVMRSNEEWMTLGGECQTSTCENGYWSGATLSDDEKGSDFMVKMQKLKNSPVKWCPISS
jgi:hypothetical protein